MLCDRRVGVARLFLGAEHGECIAISRTEIGSRFEEGTHQRALMENLLRGLAATVELIGDDWEVGDQFGASGRGSEAWKELAALLLELRIGIGDNPALKARVSCLASHDRRGARGRDPLHASRRRAGTHIGQDIVRIGDRVESRMAEQDVIEEALLEILLEIGAGAGVADLEVPGAIPELTDKQRQLLAKYKSAGGGGKWKLPSLLQLIAVLKGNEKDEAAHLAAMMILEKAEKHGDCSHAAELAKMLSPAKRENLRAWFARFSPISVDISRKQHKAHFFKSANGERKSFDLPAARRNPFYKLASH